MGRGRRPRPVVAFVFVVFILYFLGLGQAFSTFTCPPMDKPVSPMIISASGVSPLIKRTLPLIKRTPVDVIKRTRGYHY